MVGGIPGPRGEIPPARDVQAPTEQVPGRRVITRMRHGDHAVVDAAPGAAQAVDTGAVPLSVVAEDAAVALAGDVSETLALVGVTGFDYLFPALVTDRPSCCRRRRRLSRRRPSRRWTTWATQ